MAIVGLGNGGWEVACVACCQHYSSGVCHDLWFLSVLIVFFNVVSVNLIKWSVIPACPSAICCF